MEFGAELSKSLVVQRRYSGAGTGLLAKHRNPRFLSQNSTARSTAGQFCTGDRTLLQAGVQKDTARFHCNMFQNWELEPTAVVVCLDLCCRQTRREGRVKINEQNWVLTSWQAAGLWQCSSHRLRIVGAGPTQWARPSPRLIIVISSGHALNPPSTTCPSNKCDGCFYLQPFNKPDLAGQECFALRGSSQEFSYENEISVKAHQAGPQVPPLG